jgi:membrane associated rhomboid family serine protease
VIPLGDVIPSRTVPIVTILIIAVNALVFLLELVAMQEGVIDRCVYAYAMIPAEFSWPSVFSSMFLHGSLMHFLGNMMFLWIFGDNVEDRFGHGRYAVFYAVSGAVAALGHVYADPMSPVPTIGASGAVAGVMGAYFVMYPHSRVLTWIPPLFLIEVPAVIFLGLWFILQLFSGVGDTMRAAAGGQPGGVAFWAHVGGFIVGATLSVVLQRPERSRVEWWHDQ